MGLRNNIAWFFNVKTLLITIKMTWLILEKEKLSLCLFGGRVSFLESKLIWVFHHPYNLTKHLI